MANQHRLDSPILVEKDDKLIITITFYILVSFQLNKAASIEAGVNLTWRPYVGDRGRSVSIEHFGASADYKTLFEKFGITADAVVEAARATVKENNA